MQTASHFAGSIQAGDGCAVGFEHLRLSVHTQSTHRVVDGGGDADGIIGSRLQWGRHLRGSPTEVFVCSRFLLGSIATHRLVQHIGWDTRNFGQFLDGVSFLEQMLVGIRLDGSQRLAYGLVEDEECLP